MKFLEYSCFKPPQHDFSQTKSQSSWFPVFGESIQPSQRSNHAVCSFGNKIFMYGGRGSKGTLNHFWIFDCDNFQWVEIPPQKDSPPRLEGHTMVVYQGRIYVFGGETSFASADESPLWSYNIEERVWSKICFHGTVMEPGGRRQHTAVLYMDIMCVYGGYQDLIGPIKEMWLFDFETRTWHFDVAASNESAPDGRYGHSAAVHDQSMWVCGGLTGLKPTSDVIVWNFELMNWIAVKTKSGPAELSGHSMSLMDGSMYVFGGTETFGKTSGDVWTLSLSDPVWRKCPHKDLKPPSVSGHSMILLRSPRLLKRGYRTRSFPDVRKKRAVIKDSTDKERSVSCGKLPNKAKSASESTVFVNASATSDTAALVPSGDNKFEYAYDNPLMFPKQLTPISSNRPSRLPVSTDYTVDRLSARGDYVTSRMKYGNITNGSSLKIFSYNLIDDSLQGNERALKLSETSFIDISKAASSHVCVTDVTTGTAELPKKNGYPVITHVKPLHSSPSNVAYLELESMDREVTKSNYDSVVSEVSDSATADRTCSANFPGRLKTRLVCENDEQFMLMVLGGKVSNNNPASKQFLMWQCTITPCPL